MDDDGGLDLSPRAPRATRDRRARALANSVAPPSGGITRADRSEQSEGTGLNELSLCQSMLASW